MYVYSLVLAVVKLYIQFLYFRTEILSDYSKEVCFSPEHRRLTKNVKFLWQTYLWQNRWLRSNYLLLGVIPHPKDSQSLVYWNHWTNYALLFHKSDQGFYFFKGDLIFHGNILDLEKVYLKGQKKYKSISDKFLSYCT